MLFPKYKKSLFWENIRTFLILGIESFISLSIRKLFLRKCKKKFRMDYFYFLSLECSLLKSFNLKAGKFNFSKFHFLEIKERLFKENIRNPFRVFFLFSKLGLKSGPGSPIIYYCSGIFLLTLNRFDTLFCFLFLASKCQLA